MISLPVAAILYPDFESNWTTLISQDPGMASLTLDHGLGELPAIVDIQVKSLDEPNMDFIFPASGISITLTLCMLGKQLHQTTL